MAPLSRTITPTVPLARNRVGVGLSPAVRRAGVAGVDVGTTLLSA